jgi:flagellar basal body-associated protein FliL
MTKSSSSTTSSTASPPKDIEQQGAAAATTTEATTTTTNAMKGKRRRIVFISLTVGVLVAVCVIVGLSVASSKKASALGEDGSDSGGGFLSNLFVKAQCTEPCVPGSEDIMDPKSHGTSEYPVQNPLRWDCDFETADRISNFNR